MTLTMKVREGEICSDLKAACLGMKYYLYFNSCISCNKSLGDEQRFGHLNMCMNL